MLRADERLANLGAVYMEGNIYWLGSITQLNDTAFLNVEVKYHLESQSKKYYYKSIFL